MNKYLRRSAERGQGEHGWLHAKHSFSFGEYRDEHHMGFGLLRVINEDRIDGGAGFPTHGHRDMEIITYIIDGALAHKDSMGNSEVMHRGEIQRMSAGTGVRHSEFNHESDRQTHLLQIWILPERLGVAPSYEQKSFADKSEPWFLAVSRDAKNGALAINQDIHLYVGRFKTAHSQKYRPDSNRKIWIQMVSGEMMVAGESLKAGDGLGLENAENLDMQSTGACEFLFFDMVA